jgi:thiol-disulfide isomerase/thioredoxin
MKKTLFPIMILLILSMISCAQEDTNSSDNTVKGGEPAVYSMYNETKESVYVSPRCGGDEYPCPPYGMSQYDTVKDFPIFPAGDTSDLDADQNGMMWLNLLQEQHLDGKKTLAIVLTAGWCSVCKMEMPALKTIYDDYKDDVVFLLVVAENNTPGEAATPDFARNYGNYYKSGDYDNVYVTNSARGAFDGLIDGGFPTNVFLDLRKMKVLDISSGWGDISTYETDLIAAIAASK